MRELLCLVLLVSAVQASEMTCAASNEGKDRPRAKHSAHVWPLWDGKESNADYAVRVGLPATKQLNLGDGVTLNLVLIPAGKFVMGTPKPEYVNEGSFQKEIVVGQALLAAGVSISVILLLSVLYRAASGRRRPQLALARLLVLTITAGVGLYGGLQWRQAGEDFRTARLAYEQAKAVYNANFPEEQPAHAVTITRPFYMGVYEVTAEQVGVRGCPANFPVVGADWTTVQEFCRGFSTHTGQTIRLPTEAEWEYACRAGTNMLYYSGDLEVDLKRIAQNYDNAFAIGLVGQMAPNAFGLYDMLGNAMEWCEDYYSMNYYQDSPEIDPQGPKEGLERVIRGGEWRRAPGRVSSFRRNHRLPGFECTDAYIRFCVGFRVVCEVDEE